MKMTYLFLLDRSRIVLLAKIFAFLALILSFLLTVTMAMLLKETVIRSLTQLNFVA